MEWPTVDSELLALLPPVLKAVVKALGYVRARDWLVERGGVNINIPARKTVAIGLEQDELERLRQMLAPHMDAAGRVWLPKPDKLWQVVRNTAIRETSRQQSIRDQALQYRLSSRQITNIRSDVPDGSAGQLDLFG